MKLKLDDKTAYTVIIGCSVIMTVGFLVAERHVVKQATLSRQEGSKIFADHLAKSRIDNAVRGPRENVSAYVPPEVVKESVQGDVDEDMTDYQPPFEDLPVSGFNPTIPDA